MEIRAIMRTIEILLEYKKENNILITVLYIGLFYPFCFYFKNKTKNILILSGLVVLPIN